MSLMSRSGTMQGRGSTSPRPLQSVGTAAGLPPRAAQAAIILGFLLGTWMLVNSVQCWITGAYLPVAPRLLGNWTPALALLVFVLGVLWMLVPNLYLFQNRLTTWKTMVVLIVVSAWSFGAVTPVLCVQLILLLLPRSRRALAV